jgi:hypothetical protein
MMDETFACVIIAQNYFAWANFHYEGSYTYDFACAKFFIVTTCFSMQNKLIWLLLLVTAK